MKTEKQQTAVEWYAEEAMRLEIKKTKGNISVYQMLNELSNVLNQAKEMEKEQIIKAQIELIKSIVNQGHNNPLYGILKKTLIELQKQYNEIIARYV